MSIEHNSKHYKSYYKQVLNGKRTDGILGKIYDIIDDFSDRRGLRQEWEQIDGIIQDEIISDWIKILSQNKPVHKLVKELVNDICDRNGIGDQWNMIDLDIRNEIVNVWESILKSEK